MNLNYQEMEIVESLFNAAFNHVIGNVVGERKAKLIGFVLDLAVSHKPYMLITDEGLLKLRDVIFSDEDYRDFIFTLHFAFFSRWGENNAKTQALAANLADGASLNRNDLDANIMPSQLAMRLAARGDTVEILNANSWLVIVMLIQLYITLPASMTKG